MKSDDDGKYQDYNAPRHQTMLSAKDALRYIAILNGDDDVEVEDSIRCECNSNALFKKRFVIESH